jgi:hypothetical protein
MSSHVVDRFVGQFSAPFSFPFLTAVRRLFPALAVLFFAVAVQADPVPDCEGEDGNLGVDNARVVDWKSSTPNQFHARANVSGPITRLFEDRNNHLHFEIALGDGRGEVLEVVYNLSFGRIPPLSKGMNVQACGDYITSIAQSGPYPPSPSGAIIHWVHHNPRNSGHPHGFVVVENSLYGFDWGVVNGGRPKSGRGRRHDFFEAVPAVFGWLASDAEAMVVTR